MTEIPDEIMAKARLKALAVERYPLLETEKFHSEVSLARGTLRSGFKEGYAAALLSERTAREAALKEAREVAEWYGEQAEAAQRHVEKKNTDAMTTILVTMSLDGGKRARAFLAKT